MAEYTQNYNLKKPAEEDFYNVKDFNDNADIIDQALKSHDDALATKETPAGAQAKAEAAVTAHDTKDKHIAYAVANGTNTYTVTIPGITQLVEGMSVKLKFGNANTGASTLNINGLGAKSIVKSNGNALTSGNIKAGQILHLVYTGSNFQLLGEGGEYGTAQPQHVLEGYTIGTEEGIKEGTMSNYGDKTFTPSDSTQTSGAGYYNSITVNPRPTLSGNASTSHVLNGYTFYSNNYTKQTGTMPNQGAKIITPSTVNQAIPAGYHNGSGYVKGDVNLVPENIKSGVSIFGKVGTLIPYPVSTDGDYMIYNHLESAYTDGTTQWVTLFKYIINLFGTIRVTFYASNSNDRDFTVGVKHNGELIYQYSDNGTNAPELSVIISDINYGDTIELCAKPAATGSSYRVRIYDQRIYSSVPPFVLPVE